MWHKRYTCGGTSYQAITSLNRYTESLKLKSDLHRQFSLSSLMLNITLKLQWVFTYHIPRQSLFSFFRTFRILLIPVYVPKFARFWMFIIFCIIKNLYHIAFYHIWSSQFLYHISFYHILKTLSYSFYHIKYDKNSSLSYFLKYDKKHKIWWKK